MSFIIDVLFKEVLTYYDSQYVRNSLNETFIMRDIKRLMPSLDVTLNIYIYKGNLSKNIAVCEWVSNLFVISIFLIFSFV